MTGNGNRFPSNNKKYTYMKSTVSKDAARGLRVELQPTALFLARQGRFTRTTPK
jgi:hypothetical protein